jgi:hypothetical protein
MFGLFICASPNKVIVNIQIVQTTQTTFSITLRSLDTSLSGQ